MMQLDKSTWIRFTVWMAVGTPTPPTRANAAALAALLITLLSVSATGFAIYFFYGIKHSSEGEGRGRSPRQYEPALQCKSPIYTGDPVDSDVEAGGP